MRTLRFLAFSASLAFLLAGCSNGPATGTTASPIDAAEAASQGQGIESYMKEIKGKKPVKAKRDLANP